MRTQRWYALVEDQLHIYDAPIRAQATHMEVLPALRLAWAFNTFILLPVWE